VRCFDDGETDGAGQVGQLQESLSDLQNLATQIGAGDVQRDDVLWRLRSYFHVVGVVIDEFSRGTARSQKTEVAVTLLGEIQRLVGDLIRELADEDQRGLVQDESFGAQVLSDRTSGISSMTPFPSHRPIDSEDRW
jgi:GTPase